jgi:hypothetical protein
MGKDIELRRLNRFADQSLVAEVPYWGSPQGKRRAELRRPVPRAAI